MSSPHDDISRLHRGLYLSRLEQRGNRVRFHLADGDGCIEIRITIEGWHLDHCLYAIEGAENAIDSEVTHAWLVRPCTYLDLCTPCHSFDEAAEAIAANKALSFCMDDDEVSADNWSGDDYGTRGYDQELRTFHIEIGTTKGPIILRYAIKDGDSGSVGHIASFV